jgi:hypothetical protein
MVARRPWLFGLGGSVFRSTLPLLKLLRLPLLRDWLASRDLPAAPRQSFRRQWDRRLPPEPTVASGQPSARKEKA